MSGPCIFLAMVTMTQVKAFEIPLNFKFRGATQTRAKVISHNVSFNYLQLVCISVYSSSPVSFIQEPCCSDDTTEI